VLELFKIYINGENMSEEASNSKCRSLANSNIYLLNSVNASLVEEKIYKKYSFSWLGLIDEGSINIVFMTATPARFNNSTSHLIDDETFDKIYFAPAVEAIKSKKHHILKVGKKEKFPSRRDSDPDFNSLIAFPLFLHDEIYAVFCIYSMGEDIDENEVGILKRLAYDMTLTMNKDNMDELLEGLKVY